MEKIEIMPSRKRLVILVLLGLLLVAGSLFVIYLSLQENSTFTVSRMPVPNFLLTIIGAVGTLMFGYFGFYALKRLANPTPSLVLSKDGFTDNASAIGAGTIRWEDINGLQIVKISGQKMMGLSVENPQEIVERFSGLKRKAVQTNIKMYGFPVYIPQSTLSMPLEEVAEHIGKFKEASGGISGAKS